MRPRLRRPRDRQELLILAGSVAVLALIWIFAMLADKVLEGDTRQFDEWVLCSVLFVCTGTYVINEFNSIYYTNQFFSLYIQLPRYPYTTTQEYCIIIILQCS